MKKYTFKEFKKDVLVDGKFDKLFELKKFEDRYGYKAISIDRYDINDDEFYTVNYSDYDDEIVEHIDFEDLNNTLFIEEKDVINKVELLNSKIKDLYIVTEEYGNKDYKYTCISIKSKKVFIDEEKKVANIFYGYMPKYIDLDMIESTIKGVSKGCYSTNDGLGVSEFTTIKTCTFSKDKALEMYKKIESKYPDCIKIYNI